MTDVHHIITKYQNIMTKYHYIMKHLITRQLWRSIINQPHFNIKMLPLFLHADMKVNCN